MLQKTSQKALLHSIVASASLKPAEAELVLDCLVEQLSLALAKGQRISLPRLGTFEAYLRAERQGRHPQTGEALTIAASKQVRFRPAQALKDALNPPHNK
ncbi:HU family DNA-binding protein [Agaribacterium sp. ZY112]|uniref:HU family DNA-binding protein n=1 Tax=Agaribacterium sp. ZY112 TaxID=3233574 RepID=UPI00352628BA